MKKVIIYKRVSTRKQGESGLGLEAQEAYIRHFANDCDVVNTYTEVASAKSINERPLLQTAINEAKEKDCYLLVAKIDRLSRKTEDALLIFEQLDSKLLSCDIPNLDKFTLTLFMAIADRERELISVRTKAALQAKKQKGAQLGNTRNMTKEGRAKGAAANSAKARSKKENVQASFVAKSLRSEGGTLRSIAAKLNEMNYKTSRGKEFKATTVQRLLAY